MGLSLRSSYALDDSQIMRAAPSIFAEAPHDSRSDRYAYIPTIDVLNALRAEGFEPFFAQQATPRTHEKMNHTKHVVRLRHASRAQSNKDEASEILLINSHDGSCSYRMMMGCFRFVCANGMILGDAQDDVRVRHSGKGDIIGEVIEGAYSVLENFEIAEQQRDTMKSLVLSEQEQEIFADTMLGYRYENQDTPPPVTPQQVLAPRRFEDKKPDLWTTTSRIQENVIKGGLVGRNAKGRRMRTRAIKGIDSDVKLNRALWEMANKMAEIKQ